MAGAFVQNGLGRMQMQDLPARKRAAKQGFGVKVRRIPRPADVTDHLREYATFKAMGYGPRFFLGVLSEEALVLGILGIISVLIVGTSILTLMGAITTLPLARTPSMGVSVFLGTILFSSLSATIATRRLASADPADLFKVSHG